MPESFLVIVKCMTFNHHAYIEDAMNGFCMQKTDFPYLCIVMDDCSTDGEQEVIKNYVAEHFNSITNEETDDYVLNLCQHKTNENCYFAVFYLKYNHYSIKKSKITYYSRWQDKCKYVALCEGDDYWIDEKKLQIQVNVIEKEPDAVMCFSDYETVDGKGQKINRDRFEKLKRLVKYDAIESLLLTNYILTCTVLFKPEVYETDFYINCSKKYDYTLFFSAAFLGAVSYVDKKLASYRKQNNSLTNSNQTKHKVEHDIFDIHKDACIFFLNAHKKNISFVTKCKCKYNMMLFAIHIWRINYDKKFVFKLLKLDYSLIIFYVFALCRKASEYILRFLGIYNFQYSND